MAVKPIDLPSSAGLDYSGGDVRHFAQGDGVTVPGLSNPTRQLAQRDNILAEKVNEIVAVVNNQEQFVPLAIVRTVVPSGEELTVTNYRIPAGFEARVLNAVIYATASATSAEMDIYYSTTYGATSGESVVTCTPGSEFTGEVNFHQEGEFVVVLKNTGDVSLELAGSVMLTMRPVGAEGTLLVGSVIEGKEGKPGQRGARGEKGDTGTGTAGSPGMVWKGNWASGSPYIPNDVVAYQFTGTYGSWICRNAHTAGAGNSPAVDMTTWNAVAFGIKGDKGDDGDPGTGVIPDYFTTSVDVSLETGSDWQGIAITGYDAQATSPSNTYTIGVDQHYIESTTSGTSPKGYAWLSGVVRLAFRGSGTITLPKISGGAKLDYSNGYIDVVAVANGTSIVENYMSNSQARLCTCIPKDSDKYVVKVLNNNPVWVAFVASGMQPIP